MTAGDQFTRNPGSEPANNLVERKVRASEALILEVRSVTRITEQTLAHGLQPSLVSIHFETILSATRLRTLPLAELPPRLRRIPLFRLAFIARFTLKLWNYFSKPQREQTALLCDCIEILEQRLGAIEHAELYKE